MSSERLYDVVVFGASGFTGQFVVDEVARVADEDNVTWAIAGRNMQKLQSVLEAASQRTGRKLEETPIIIADVSSEESLLDMCKQARVVINCVGPYRFHGENLVKASIESGANHVDISGEPQFLEKMQLLYSGKAKEAGVYIVGSCGFDSIPADMGILYTQKKFKGDVNSVEAFLDINTGPDGVGINFATYESAVHGYANSAELRETRKSLFPTPLPKSSYKLKRRSPLSFCEELGKYIMPFPGADHSVVMRTQRYNYDVKKQRPIQMGCYFCRPSLFYSLVMAFFGVLFGIFASFSFGRSLLLKFPGLFTAGMVKRGGPSKKQIEETSFSMTFIASGFSKSLADPDAQHEEAPDKTMTTKVIGPELGYVTTPICVVQSAVVILKEKGKLPQGGGVFTPGSAFADTSLIDRLQKKNVLFQEVEEMKTESAKPTQPTEPAESAEPQES